MAVVNRMLVIPKLHYFLVFGCMGGTLPFLMTMATQLGSSMAMVGLIYATMPFVVMIAKPCFGSLADKLQQKKPIFLACIALMVASLFALYFVPHIGDDGGDTTSINTSVVCNANGSSLFVCGRTLSTNLESHHDNVSLSTTVPITTVSSCLVTCSLVNSGNPVFESLCLNSRLCALDSPAIDQIGNLSQINPSLVSPRSLEFHTAVDVSRSHHHDGCLSLPLSGYQIDNVFRGNPSCIESEVVLTSCHFQCDGRLNSVESNVTEREDNDGGGHRRHHQVTDIDGDAFQVNRQIVFLWLCMVCAWIGMGAAVSMGDTIVLDLMEDKSMFGRQRLWGAVGWGSVSVATGQMVDMASRGLGKRLDFTPCYFVTLALGALDVAFASQIRVDRVERPRHILRHVAKLFTDPSVSVFALSVLLVGCLTGVLWTFLIVYLNELGASQMLVGLTLAVQCFLGEIPFFFVSGWFLKKIGHAHAMTLVLFIFGARYVLYSYVDDPWLVLPVELTQGITYGIFFTALATYPSLIAPANTQATVQGVFQGIFEGFGVGIGCFVGGILYQSVGGKMMFHYCGWFSCCMGALVGLLQFWLSRRSSGSLSTTPVTGQGAHEDVKQEEMVRMYSDNQSV